MKKKRFDRDKMYDKNLDNNTDHELDQKLSYKMDIKSDEAIENALKSVFVEEEKNLHLSAEFKSSLIAKMEESSDDERVNNAVSNDVAFEGRTNLTASDDAETDETNIKAAASSIGVIRSIRYFLNMEIEIPLVPVLAASILLIAINVMPLNYEPRPEGRLIEVGGAQLWIPNNGEGEDFSNEN